jgi:hypothetical protein
VGIGNMVHDRHASDSEAAITHQRRYFGIEVYRVGLLKLSHTSWLIAVALTSLRNPTKAVCGW